ncbi:THO complex subunit mft1 [Pleurostoma richardsiae]|uniref:THO complex subunit mft1 n=1 Tax=Pleurostoma richardsiae TaxID=41990 RepID=A0AA38VYI0_9PEZI|nr:THO complex subunit mft1 [Pleurostoma richardsiae]
MASWQLLDPEDENQLHKSRLFSIEEKPFKRITKRLVAINAAANSQVRQVLTPPPEPNGEQDGQADTKPPAATNGTAKDLDLDFEQLKEDITFDFAAFDGTIARLQFLLSANEKQRERYAAERVSILQTCQGVRDNTTQLRAQLDRARATLAQRKRFDELAARITSNKLLRARSEQEANLVKLEDECRQLEAESETYAATWRERRDQFERIMDESMRLRRLIRDEKEEVERREGMDGEEGGGEGGGEGDAESSHQTPRPGIASGNATPRPDSGPVSALRPENHENTAGTPKAVSTGGRTPMRDSPPPGGHGELKPPGDNGESFSQEGNSGPSRDHSPSRGDAAESGEAEQGGDVEMNDAARPSDTPMEGTQTEGTPRIILGDAMDTT